MSGLWTRFWKAFRKGDNVLLLLCVLTTIYGCLVIASTTNYMQTARYVLVQVLGAVLGIMLYIIMSSVDAEFFSEHRRALVVLNTVLLLMLIPFGTDMGSGNKSWIDLPLLPINLQPAEICKITYILITASVMSAHQNNVSSVPSVLHMALHLAILAGLNIALSRDAGVSLIFVFIFIGMAFAGGVSMLWFAVGAGALVAAAPVIWNYVMGSYQRLRIEVLFNPDLDPYGTDSRYHTVKSLKSLTGGGLTGQGLFQGTRTQVEGELFAQHTDFIFSAIGEELGYLGCGLVILLLVAIIWRCIWVGNRSSDYMRRLICYGAASALIFQMVINIGMCIGVMPVIGLTLPFISYGGSSIVSLYAMLGLVSGVYARPAAASHERYIRAPLNFHR